jgi:hypothetical protein
MSTRGLYIFKYKGKYYVFYNGHDSYPEGPYGLCSRLIQNLRKLTREQIIELLEKLVLLHEEHVTANESQECNQDGETDFISIEDALTRPYAYWRFFVRDKELKKNVVINNLEDFNWDLYDMEYVYTMNFDQELFTIMETYYDVKVHYSLFNIPDDWYDLYQKVIENEEEQ